VDNPGGNPKPDDLITFLCGSLAVLWKDWPKQMHCTVLDQSNYKSSLTGECPFYHHSSVFVQVTSVYHFDRDNKHMLCAGMECQGCRGHILGIVEFINSEFWAYDVHYPMGSPDDSVDKSIPKSISDDFSEAMRCLWIKSYKAAVAMCRRSVEAACHDLEATGRNLYEKIEDLASKGVITDRMRRMAHRVRLTGNKNLHGEAKAPDSHFDADDLSGMKERDALAMITFTKEFFHHIYAIEALLKQYENPEGETPEAS
jgi:hypothetical protein